MVKRLYIANQQKHQKLTKQTNTNVNIPQLRFSEFEGEWKAKPFDKLVKKSREKYNPLNEIENYPCIELESLSQETGILLNTFNSKEQLSIKNLFKKGDVLYGKLRPYLRKYLKAEFDGVCSSEIWVLKGTEISSDFLYTLVQGNKFNRVANVSSGSKMPRADWEYISSIPFYFPSLKEQQKIAQSLTAIDTKIQQLTQKKALLQQYKKGAMQQIFSQQIRFKQEDGTDFSDWRERKLEDIAKRVKRKNKENNKQVLTISAQYGLVSQTDFFNKSVASKNLLGYYLLHKGDFAYNKSYSNGYPMGAFKRLTLYDKGVLSTLYICFRILKNHSESYFEQFFESGALNRELSKIAQEGARNHGLLNMGIGDFFQIKLTVPCIEEQQKIAHFLTSIDQKINQVSNQITLTENYKKGLLQQLFV